MRFAVLEAAARAKGADAPVRQNLALAHALPGDWTKARTDRGAGRSGEPARRSDPSVDAAGQPGKASDQVAALVGVTPAAVDQGQPVRLALRKPDTMMASRFSCSDPHRSLRLLRRLSQ